MYFDRSISKVILETSETFPVVLITGPRQVGKSTVFDNRATKTPKLHFMDTGLCAYLCGWTSTETLSTGAMSGAFFESYVVSEIIKSYLHNNEQAQFYFYRDKEKQEIDLIIERDNVFYPIEIKRTASPQASDVKMFGLLKKIGLTTGKGSIICLYDNLLPLNGETWTVPVGYLG